jgi:hypothetical protein
LRGPKYSTGVVVITISKKTGPLGVVGSTVAEQTRLVRVQVSEEPGPSIIIIVTSKQRTRLWLVLLLVGVIAEEAGSRRLALRISKESSTGIGVATTEEWLLSRVAASAKQSGRLVGAASTTEEASLRLCPSVTVPEQPSTSVGRIGIAEEPSCWLGLRGTCAESATKKRLLLILILVLTKEALSLIAVVAPEQIAAARTTKRIGIGSRVRIAAETKPGRGVRAGISKETARRLVLIATEQV